ncbi:MAG: hypothetical protein ACI8TP_000779 [Acidimicrobiales bacterium]|jgi:hypothetical protein
MPLVGNATTVLGPVTAPQTREDRFDPGRDGA